MVAPVRAGGAPGGVRPRGSRWRATVPTVPAVAAAVALFLPWWQAPGPVLLDGGPLRALPPDVWTGSGVAGSRTVPVVALAVVTALAAVVDVRGRGATATRVCATATGAAAAACGVVTLIAWGSTGAPGAWLAVAAGLAAVGVALVHRGRTALLLCVALVTAGGIVAVPGGQEVPDRTAAGPFLRVAALGAWRPVRSGAAGLSDSGYDALAVVVDGAPGVVGEAGVLVADRRGRARVLARTADGAPPPLGVVGGRVVRWITADTLAVTELRADGPLRVLVRDVGAASVLGDDGSVWVRSDVDPPGTVRRLDVAAYDGEQDLSATYLPVVTIRSPDGEPPIDVRTVRPVPGGALRLVSPPSGTQVQLLTTTSAGITARPMTAPPSPRCYASSLNSVGDVRRTAADATGIWYPTPDGWLAHRDPDGTVRLVTARLPGPILALAAPGDGSLVFAGQDVARDSPHALWRLPDATAALGDPVTCGNG